jgi:hypothetical protein
MNINNEQRKAFADIVEQNGRAEEFYAKYGKSRIVKNEKTAQAILNQIVANDELQKKMDKKNREEREALEAKQDKAKKVVADAGRTLDEKLTKLGYSQGNEYVGGIYQAVLREDTSITRAEYEMFKKHAIADIWGAESLEVGKKAIDNYLNLVK